MLIYTQISNLNIKLHHSLSSLLYRVSLVNADVQEMSIGCSLGGSGSGNRSTGKRMSEKMSENGRDIDSVVRGWGTKDPKKA